MKGQGARPKRLKREIPFPPYRKDKNTFSFIDLFAGMGGFRLAMQQLGGRCVFSGEWDRWAQKTYEANFGKVPSGDITKIRADKVPEHDILCTGFPCQAFTLAGQRRGFEDTRGTLFFDIARTLKAKRPAVFLLENLKGLMSHRAGQTLAAILSVLRDELGYFVPTPQVIKAEKSRVDNVLEQVFPVESHSDLNINRFNYACPSKV
jgi:DNA (cytosine-5)-methyltransferase 1